MFNGMFQKIVISHIHFRERLQNSVYIYCVHLRITCAERVLNRLKSGIAFFSFHFRYTVKAWRYSDSIQYVHPNWRIKIIQILPLNFFKKLLKYNSCIMEFTLSTCVVQYLLVQRCVTCDHSQFQSLSITPQKKPCIPQPPPVAFHPSAPGNPQSNICLCRHACSGYFI